LVCILCLWERLIYFGGKGRGWELKMEMAFGDFLRVPAFFWEAGCFFTGKTGNAVQSALEAGD